MNGRRIFKGKYQREKEERKENNHTGGKYIIIDGKKN